MSVTLPLVELFARREKKSFITCVNSEDYDQQWPAQSHQSNRGSLYML